MCTPLQERAKGSACLAQATLLQQKVLVGIDGCQGLCPCGRDTGQIPDGKAIDGLDQPPATCLNLTPGVVEMHIGCETDRRIPAGMKHRADQVLVRVEACVVSDSVTGTIEKMLDVAAPCAVIHHLRNPLMQAPRKVSGTENLPKRKDLLNDFP